MGAQVFETDKFKRMNVSGLEHHRWGLISFKGLRPTRDAEAPMVAGIQTWEVVLGDRGGEVIAAISAEGQKCFRHDGADGVQPFVIWSGPAKAVAIEAGDGAVTASLQGSSEDV